MPRGWRLRWLRVHDPILPYLTLSYPTLLYLPLPLTPPITNPTHLSYILYVIPTYLPTYLPSTGELPLPAVVDTKLPLPLTPPITNPTHLLYILYIPTYLPTYLLQESSLSLPWSTPSPPVSSPLLRRCAPSSPSPPSPCHLIGQGKSNG